LGEVHLATGRFSGPISPGGATHGLITVPAATAAPFTEDDLELLRLALAAQGDVGDGQPSICNFRRAAARRSTDDLTGLASHGTSRISSFGAEMGGGPPLQVPRSG